MLRKKQTNTTKEVEKENEEERKTKGKKKNKQTKNISLQGIEAKPSTPLSVSCCTITQVEWHSST